MTSLASRGTKWGKTGHQCCGVGKGQPWAALQFCVEGKEKEKREKEPIISEFPFGLAKPRISKEQRDLGK